jgi:hypothetical protein
VTTRLTPSPSAAADAGGVLFARYAYPPDELARSGPTDFEAVFAGAAGGQDPRGVRERAEAFTGAWPYLCLIAAHNGIAEPLDPRVVRAYWLGTGAVRAVPLRALADHVDGGFRQRAGTGWPHLGAALQPGAVPDHAFHVLAVYPWVGLLQEGPAEPARSMLESCCIRPGRVITVDGPTAVVALPTLEWTGDRLRLGPDEERTLRWRRGGLGLAGDLRVGDRVTAHWDWVCERLPAPAAAALRVRLVARLAAVRC